MKSRSKAFILWFDQVGIDDISLVGGKNASLGEMLQSKDVEVKIPPGFAITATAYKYFIENAGILKNLKAALNGLDIKNPKALATAGKTARKMILESELPDELEKSITVAYQRLCFLNKVDRLDVAVRSSATAEDLPSASFAGQQESFLNINSLPELLKACKKCFASLFTDRAIVYRVENNFDHFKVFLSIGVQKMVRSDLASAGVIFTLDTESGFSNVVFITGSYGLGESVVQGTVNPDEFYAFKPTLKQGYKPLIDKRLGDKATKFIYSKTLANPIKKVNTPLKDRKEYCITNQEALLLAKWAVAVEDHYSAKYGKWTPMDLEWAKDGLTGELFIIQARPETVQSQKNRNIIEEYKLLQKGKVLVKGKSVGRKITQGKARVIHDVKDIAKFKAGEILITDSTDPNWMPIMRTASAIVTNRGGRTSHAAIVSRELGLPCIVGTNNVTEIVKTGQNITVSCAEGENGIVYDGKLDYKIEKIDVAKAPKPKTKIMLNVSSPDEAFELSFLPSDGVGLAREEFIVSEYIRIHPMALLNFEQVKEAKIRRQINELTSGYSDKRQYYIDKLASGIAIIAAAFYPRDVILRFSDFKTNEYTNLLGGKYFEPKEENPMIGWRGASRYYSPGYKEGFKLECEAIKKVRDEFGLMNLKVMIPVCRTLEEGKKVLKVMKENGLEKGKNGLEVYVMCEIPSNVILSDQFCEIFDGFSIGSNDLTQMTLGVDRDNELVAEVFDERNEAVIRMIKHVIETAKKHHRKIGICGDAPSTYSEFAKFLVDCGIDSISLSSDALLRTSDIIAKYENKKQK
jgi:pyruvate, water dikinase